MLTNMFVSNIIYVNLFIYNYHLKVYDKNKTKRMGPTYCKIKYIPEMSINIP